MNNLITKIWLFLLLSIIIALGIFVSVFFLVAIVFILIITVPYVLYIKWRAKKEFKRYYFENKALKENYMEDSNG